MHTGSLYELSPISDHSFPINIEKSMDLLNLTKDEIGEPKNWVGDIAENAWLTQPSAGA